MKSAMQLIVKCSFAVVFMAGLSLSLASPAQATAIFEVPEYVIAELTFELPEMVSFNGATFDDESTDGTMGNATADAEGEALATENLLRARTFVNGEANPVGWAVAEARAVATGFFTNMSTESISFNVLITALKGSASGSIDDPLNESSEAEFNAELLFDKEVILFASAGGAVPPEFAFSVSDEIEPFAFAFSLDPGEMRSITVRSSARGEAHSAVPEPTSLLLLGSGMIGLGVWQWRRNKKIQNAA